MGRKQIHMFFSSSLSNAGTTHTHTVADSCCQASLIVVLFSEQAAAPWMQCPGTGHDCIGPKESHPSSDPRLEQVCHLLVEHPHSRISFFHLGVFDQFLTKLQGEPASCFFRRYDEIFAMQPWAWDDAGWSQKTLIFPTISNQSYGVYFSCRRFLKVTAKISATIGNGTYFSSKVDLGIHT